MEQNKPIDVSQCRKSCLEFPRERQLEDLVTFLGSFSAPKFPEKPAHNDSYELGKSVFTENCASCHSMEGEQRHALTNDEITLFLDHPEVTHNCRALTTNWDRDQLWAEFSSDQFKQRVEDTGKGYRTMPLAGSWATSPFLHNQSVGELAPASASIQDRAAAFRRSMFELLSENREPIVHRLPEGISADLPAGTPIVPMFSRDPDTGEILCQDIEENRGHTFGSELAEEEKKALIYWLQYQ